MQRIVTHLLVAIGLAAGACGVAQAHTDLSIGLSLGAPAPVYVQPAPVYAEPQPVYYGHPAWDRGNDHRFDHGYRPDPRWNQGEHRGNYGGNYGSDYRGNDRGWSRVGGHDQGWHG